MRGEEKIKEERRGVMREEKGMEVNGRGGDGEGKGRRDDKRR